MVRTVWSWKKVEEACYTWINAVTRGSNCLELKRSETSLLHANRHGTWFALFGAETKWKNFVACKWTRLCLVPSVWGWNEVEQACCMRTDAVTHGSYSLELKRSGTSLLHANRNCYACFLMFADETKWNWIVACEWTSLCMLMIWNKLVRCH